MAVGSPAALRFFFLQNAAGLRNTRSLRSSTRLLTPGFRIECAAYSDMCG